MLNILEFLNKKLTCSELFSSWPHRESLQEYFSGSLCSLDERELCLWQVKLYWG